MSEFLLNVWRHVCSTTVCNTIFLGLAGAAAACVVAWRTLFPWIKYDIEFIRAGLKIAKRMKKSIATKRFVIDMFEESTRRVPKKPFLIFEDKIYTYEFMNEQANKVANIASNWGLEVSDTVGIMIYNSPEFVWTFLGLQKLGIAVAFINYQLRTQPLLHVLKVNSVKTLVIGKGEEFLAALEEIKDDIKDIPKYAQGACQSELLPGYTSWDDLMLRSHPVPICKEKRETMDFTSPCCYIFTSGTTGLPKPVILSQRKCIGTASIYGAFDFCEDDVLYTALPLYHSAASTFSLFCTINVGATLVLGRKFSARNFWSDCRRHRVTVVQYIGELCRYVLSVPKHPLDSVHNVRLAVGNGLRQDIWQEFQTRFKIPIIVEAFGATEGPVALFNISNKTGSCGRISPFLNLLAELPRHLIKFDPETEQPVRDRDGRCIEIKPGEVGLLISKILKESYEKGFYMGERAHVEKKILRDVFKPGDFYFNFGDLLYLDKDYFVYFSDRIGDTYRWKGENIATLEIAHVLTTLDFVEDANVYGVKIADLEGRAGMAAVLLRDEQKLSESLLTTLYKTCEQNLPSYARPAFLRFPRDWDMTSTFKQRKLEFVKEGFDPKLISDPLFYRNDAEKTFCLLTSSNFTDVMSLRF